jgi:hypothetical protein
MFSWNPPHPMLLAPQTTASPMCLFLPACGSLYSKVSPSKRVQARRNTASLPTRIVLMCLAACSGQVLADQNIVHYDIKGDNVFLEASTPRATLDDLLNAPSEEPPFVAVLADFGETRMFRSTEDALSAR